MTQPGRNPRGYGRPYSGDQKIFDSVTGGKNHINSVLIRCWEDQGIVIPPALRRKLIAARSAESILFKYRRYRAMNRLNMVSRKGEQDAD